MAAVSAGVGEVAVDELGSHFIVRSPSRGAVADVLDRLPAAVALDGGAAWHLPAVPVAADQLRRLVETSLALSVDPAAAGLLDRLRPLPLTATAVAHLCEHRPGRLGVVVAALPEAGLHAELAALPRVRHDARFDRWWMPADDEPLAALDELMARVPALTATAELRRRLARFEQPSLSVEAVAGLEHRCAAGLVEKATGEMQLQVCRRCTPDLDRRLGDGARVRGSLQSWWVTIDADTGERLGSLLVERPELTGGDPRILEDVRRMALAAREAAELERLSTSIHGPPAIDGAERLGGTLRPFQAAAVAYALRARRTFLADEPGLGKTIQALATLEAAGAFPAVVVCPASLRLNWVNESRRWLPGRTVVASDASGAPGDVALTVVSYNALHEVADELARNPPRALVLDESHFCKNGAARRTQAAVAVASALDPHALVLLLTGTPVINRPRELTSQLRVLGREDVASERVLGRMDPAGDGPQALNRRLRRTCFVRRRKEAVLKQLPAKQRVVVPLSIGNREEYQGVERDVARWIRRQAEADAAFLAEIADLRPAEREATISARGREAEQRARRAEALVRVNKLALVAARGKLDAAAEWIDGFLESEEKLVVFARHREVTDALRAAFPDAALASGRLAADRRDAEIRRFQHDPACRLIVCSIDAAGVGVTLTAASNVAFVEMAWTAAAHDQAEDRVHRIGQASAVTAWYLLAADTIDEQMATVVEHKRRLMRGASDGVRVTEADALNAVLGWIAEHAPAR